MSTKASDREKRRANALRQNLKRRKAAERDRNETSRLRAEPKPPAPPGCVAPIAADRPNKAQKSD